MKLITLTDKYSDSKIPINPYWIIAIEHLKQINGDIVGCNIRFSGNPIVGQFKETQEEVLKLLNPMYQLNTHSGEFELI